MGNDSESGIDQEKLNALKTEITSFGKLIGDLPPEIRSAAFQLFIPLLQPKQAKGPVGASGHTGKTSQGQDKENNVELLTDLDDIGPLLEKHDVSKPSAAVYVITAYWFSQYGSTPINIDEIRRIANESGLTIPGRVDMTLKSAKEDGKGLYTTATKGSFKPTTFGETYLRKTYGVAKGNKTLAKATAE